MFSEEMAEDRLRDYFECAESVAGLRSIHGALVDRAQSGASGTRSPTAPEDRWYDARRGQVRRHQQTVRALEQLSSLHVQALWAFYGAAPWPGQAPGTLDADVGADEDQRKQRWHRSQPPPDVRAIMGPGLARVALLTAELAAAADAWEGRDRGLHTVLVSLCKAFGRADGETPLSPITKAAEALHGAALAAFGAASGLTIAPRPRYRRRAARWEAPIKPVRVAV